MWRPCVCETQKCKSVCARCSVLCQENLSKQFAFSRTFFYYFYIYFLNIFYNVLGYLLKKMQVILCIVSVFLGQFAFLSGRCASCSGVRAALGSVSFASLSWPGREGGDQPSSLWVPLFESFRVSLKLDSSRMGDLVFNVVYLFTKKTLLTLHANFEFLVQMVNQWYYIYAASIFYV